MIVELSERPASKRAAKCILQFSRECSRFFGNAPIKDIAIITHRGRTTILHTPGFYWPRG